MLTKHFVRKMQMIIELRTDLIERHNIKYNINLKGYKINIIKGMSNISLRSITLYYVIRGNSEEQLFIIENKRDLLFSLKKIIKMRKFPLLIFRYDKEYDKNINREISDLSDLTK